MSWYLSSEVDGEVLVTHERLRRIEKVFLPRRDL